MLKHLADHEAEHVEATGVVEGQEPEELSTETADCRQRHDPMWVPI
jgi:hypothetical protein